MTVGEQLRLARLDGGLTQVELAARVDITASVLSAYENGRREPGASVFLRLMAMAGSTAHWRRGPDPVECGRRLVQVLSLAEALPHRPRALATARAPWTT